MSTIENKISAIKKMRFLDHEDYEIEDIVRLLNEVGESADNNSIIALCELFHDEIFEPAIIGDLMETIFYIAQRHGIREGLLKVIEGMETMKPHAQKCMERLFKSIIDSRNLRQPFIDILSLISPSKKEEVVQLLKNIIEKQSKDYQDKHKAFIDNMEQKIHYLREFDTSANLITIKDLDESKQKLIPDSWHRLFREQDIRVRIDMLLEIWKKYVGRELSNLILYLTKNIDDIELLEIEDSDSKRYSILYTIKKPNGGVTYYEGRNPQEEFHNDELERNWDKIPVTIQQFYENVHNGFYYYASVSMGLVPLEFVTFLGDDDLDWSIIDDLKEPIQIDLNTSFGFFSNGMGSYIAVDYNNCNNGNATFWSAKLQPRYNIHFWDHVDEWIVIGFE